jgi:pyruvate ferredoxin oxidoreductase gamma subunit
VVCLIEISLFGRGGQGVVVGGEFLVKAAIAEGIYAQSIPFFGGERRGAPVSSGVRISNEPIYQHESIKKADIITIFDKSLIDFAKPLDRIKQNGVILLNTNNPQEQWPNTYYVDATSIAKDLGLVIAGWPLVNTTMLGALASITKTIDVNVLKDIVSKEFGKRGAQNAQAVERGAKEVKKIE